MKFLFSSEDLYQVSKISVLDYFIYLEHRGKVNFDRKTKQDYYFRTENNKFSVSNSAFYDFKTGKGGKIIKAVMLLENKDWKEAVKFLIEFSNIITDQKDHVAKEKIRTSEIDEQQEVTIKNVIKPNNEQLLQFFKNRGISKEIMIEHTRQIHYERNSKNYFGIGIQNESQGFEVRNPIMKTKIGINDITVIKGSNDNEIVVFEGITDMLSFLQLQKDIQFKNNRTLVVINSVINADKFMNQFHNFNGKIFLCLDGDHAGELATRKILNILEGMNIKDIRRFYNISENGNKDLNQYLINKAKVQHNSTTKYISNHESKNEDLLKIKTNQNTEQKKNMNTNKYGSQKR